MLTIDGQSASLSWFQAPIWGPRPDLYYCHTFAGLLPWDVLSNERTGLSFIIVAGPRHRSHSRVSDSRLPQLGGPDPRIYIPQEQGGPVISPSTVSPFCPFLRLTGLRWRYSNPPSHGSPHYIAPAWNAQKTSSLLLRVLLLPGKQCVLRAVS
jgi:hypothetical protein